MGSCIAQPGQYPVAVISIVEVSRTINLHQMLLFTCEQFYLNFIEVYLQGCQSVLNHGSHQLIVSSSKRPVHVA